MACVENVPPEQRVLDSEMEEGEIVDDLSDISSEEEFLLRQRLQVLENYNNVLGRKKTKAKRSRPGHKRHKLPSDDLSDISGTEFDDCSKKPPKGSSTMVVSHGALNKDLKHQLDNGNTQRTMSQSGVVYHNTRDSRPPKPKERHRKKESELPLMTNSNESKKKSYRKKRSDVKNVPHYSDSEESEDEYRNKRRKLANAVVVKGKSDTSSLQDRLNKMLYGSNKSEPVKIITENIALEKRTIEVKDASCSPIKYNAKDSIKNGIIRNESTDVKDCIIVDEKKENISSAIDSIEVINLETSDVVDEDKENKSKAIESIDLSTDDDVVVNVNADIIVENCTHDLDTVDGSTKEKTEILNEDIKEEEGKNSDDDLELLRQHALKTKSSKTTNKANHEEAIETQKPQSEDEDSDTAELRLICLKSALLKKAIEMKQKQKLNKKRLSQSIAPDDFSLQDDELHENIKSDNNTDIESMDMDIGSDGDEKIKDGDVNKNSSNVEQNGDETNKPLLNDDKKTKIDKEEELDEDEDLLRAKLLTSLSKNLPNLVDPNILNAFKESPVKKKVEQIKPTVTKKVIKKPEKRIIINVGGSDSEDEHEATTNLTKMHMQLYEQIDFQQKLDMFLKSARMEVEKGKLPDVVQQPLAPKTPQKYVAKAVDHLPESEQMEYKNLVKRMAELEKIKQARQVTVTKTNEGQKIKELTEPRIVPANSNTIVDKTDEQITLSRKKIAEESAVIMKLKEEAMKLSQKYKIVATELRNISTAITLNKKEQSSTSRHSKFNNKHALSRPSNKIQPNKSYENGPMKEEYNNVKVPKSLTISVVNDLSEKTTTLDTRLSVNVDVTSNMKTVTCPKIEHALHTKKSLENNSIPENGFHCKDLNGRGKDDYESPLQALGVGTWMADPNAILCPFEVGGHCKDADCKYLHPKPLSPH